MTSWAPPAQTTFLAHEAVVFQEATHRRVAHHRADRRVVLHHDGEVVVVELVAPPRVIPVLLLTPR